MLPRRALGSTALLAMLAGTAWHAPAPVEAQAPSLRYEVPRGCPALSEVEAALRERVPNQALEALSALRVVRAGRGVTGELTVDLASGPSRRSLRARTCREAVDALVLVAAVLLAPPEPPAASAEGLDDAAAREGPAPASAASGGAAGGSTEHAEAPLASQLAAPAAESGAQIPAEAAPEPAPKAGPSSSRRRMVWTRPDRGPWRSSLDAQAGALLVGGVVPALRPGAALELGFGTGPERPVRLSLRGGLRGTAPSTVVVSEGRARFRFLAGTLALGPTFVPARRLALTMAALAELGRLSVQGEQARNARTSRRPWRAMGATLDLAVELGRRASLVAAGELMVPLVTDRFVLAGEVLHRVPELTFRTQLALRVRIW